MKSEGKKAGIETHVVVEARLVGLASDLLVTAGRQSLYELGLFEG